MDKTEQHWKALAKANDVRERRAELRREAVAMGSMAGSLCYLADCLELADPKAPNYCWWLETLRVLVYVKWAKGVGSQRAHSILGQAVVNPERKMGELTDRERGSLDRALRDAAERRKAAPVNENETWARRVLEQVK